MIELNNRSSYAAGVFPCWSASGEPQYTLVVKKVYEYDANGSLSLLRTTPDLILADQYFAEPGQSSVVYPSEIVPFKFGSEVIVTGKVFPPVKQPPVVMEATVGLRFPNGRHWSKSLLVIGERQWQSALLGTVASDPTYLKPIELVYEYAFGGKCPENPENHCLANPVGRGFGLSRRKARGTQLPQFETPGNLIHKPGQTVPVAGFSAIPSHWAPRIDYLPEVNEEALAAGSYPYSSKLNSKWYNQAPIDQQFEHFNFDHLVLELKGLTANLDYRHTLEIKLPLVMPVAELQEVSSSSVPLKCDTLIIDTEAQSITQLWRASLLQKNRHQHCWVSLNDNTIEQPSETLNRSKERAGASHVEVAS
jgi:hypothetical protein